MWAWGPLEADFKRFYNMDLQQEGFNDWLTWRKFVLLVRGLPDDSAYTKWMRNKENRAFVESSEETIFDSIRKSRTGGK